MSTAPVGAPPEPDVLRAWGADAPQLLAGGQGDSYRCGELVLKPVLDGERSTWLGGVVEGLRPPEATLRVARPVRAASGELVVSGWMAWRWLEGEIERGRWDEVLEVSARLHRTTEAVAWSPRASGTDRWSIADRAAWGEAPVEWPDELGHLVRRLRRVDDPCQLIHGDLASNVLFHPTLAPAVIDLSPFWRPVSYADAIVVADAIAWGGAPDDLVERFLHRHGEQPLLRAVLFRVAVARSELRTYRRVIDLLER